MTPAALERLWINGLAFAAVALTTLPFWNIRAVCALFAVGLGAAFVALLVGFVRLFDPAAFLRFLRATKDGARWMRARMRRAERHAPEIVCGNRWCRRCYAGREFLLDRFEDEVRDR